MSLQCLFTDTSQTESPIQHGWDSRSRLASWQQTTMMNTSKISSNFSRAGFSSSNSSEQQCSRTFRCHQIAACPLVAQKTLEVLVHFVATDLCEQSFSSSRHGRHRNEEKEQIFFLLYVLYESGTCQGEAAHFWTCLWKATTKVTVNIIWLWNSRLVLGAFWFFCVQLMHGSFFCALAKYIYRCFEFEKKKKILTITEGLVNARVKLAGIRPYNKVKHHCSTWMPEA